MRRWLTILLLFMLPLQFSWAVAAAYCQHERDSGANHFGHHGQVHKGETAKAPEASSPDKQGALNADDADCTVCHFSCAKPVACVELSPSPPLSVGELLIPARTDELTWPLPDRIERPNWQRAA